jgi:hypothetical protein
MLGRIYRRFLNDMHVDRAFAAAMESRHQDALAILDRKVKDADDLYYVRLLRGQLHEKSESFGDALQEFIAAHELISKATQLSKVEKVYLEAFAAVSARRCAHRLPDAAALPPGIIERLRIRLEKIDLRKISGQIKAYFPLPEHPYWASEPDTDEP